MTESDENLMMSVRTGEVAKLGVLFDRHHRVLFDYFVRMTDNRMIADDLVQDVFFRILKYRNTFRGDGQFKAWMFHIARNARIDYYRSHPVEHVLPEDQVEEIHTTSPFPARQLEEKQQAEMLQCALSKLTPEKREVLVLSRYHEMKYDEISALMGCEVSTVKTRVHRAMKDLREIYKQLSRETTPCNAKKSANSLRLM
jgi:RNA polymerase sigma-70 factor (ECF subfamily)